MIHTDKSHNFSSEFMGLPSDSSVAHSGPELARCVPATRQAQELASELFADRLDVVRSEADANSNAVSFTNGGSFRLAHRQ